MKRVLSTVLVLVLAFSALTSTAAATDEGRGMWVIGDFHTHTVLSDGSYTAAEVAAKANEFGLDWYAAGDHGGFGGSANARPFSVGGRNANGNFWTEGEAEYLVPFEQADGTTRRFLPRWASIFGIGEDEINKNREKYGSDMLQFSGFEWNVPSHEHASVVMYGDSDVVRLELAKFAYMFDGNREPAVDQVDWLKDLTQRNRTHADALDAAKYLQDNFPNSSWFLPNHPTRQLAFSIADFREFNDVAPDVVFGAEMMPGHQASSWRGGLGFFRPIIDPVGKRRFDLNNAQGATLRERVNHYVEMQIEAAETEAEKEMLREAYTPATKQQMLDSIEQSRAFGGVDYFASKVGGGWDALLSEGRRFWMFGNSDFHSDPIADAAGLGVGEIQFWPGQFTRNHTFVQEKTYAGIYNGMKSGNSFVAMGDLINALDYRISGGGQSATMGQTLTSAQSEDTVVTIRFKSPETNHNGDKPTVSHIDLIAGVVTGVPENKYSGVQSDNNREYLSAEYLNDDVTATTSVIKRFDKSEFQIDAEGYMYVTFTLPETDQNMYYRLRGTNNAPGTEFVDIDGNPVIDHPIDFDAVIGGGTNLGVATVALGDGDNTAERAWTNLWFYSNPIFVNAQANRDSAAATPTTSTIIVNGEIVPFDAFLIGGYNYFRLRDLAAALGFGVDWDEARNTISIDTSKVYTGE